MYEYDISEVFQKGLFVKNLKMITSRTRNDVTYISNQKEKILLPR